MRLSQRPRQIESKLDRKMVVYDQCIAERDTTAVIPAHNHVRHLPAFPVKVQRCRRLLVLVVAVVDREKL